MHIRNVLIACALILVTAACSESSDSMAKAAATELDTKNFGSAVERANRLVAKDGKDHRGYWVLAQAQGALRQVNQSIAALELALQNGLKDRAQIEGSPYLEDVRKSTGYVALIQQYFPPSAAAPDSPPKRDEPAASVSIESKNGRQVIKAGDITIETELPAK